MSDISTDIIDRDVPYTGAVITLRTIEETVQRERDLQNVQVQELHSLRERNRELQEALREEMDRMRDIADRLQRHEDPGVLSRFLRVLGLVKPEGQQRSIEELLRRQYELSAMRLKEASEFADRLEVARIDLYDEIDRLNQRIVESKANEEVAGSHVLDLRALLQRLEVELASADTDSVEHRKIQQDLDRTRRTLAEHSMRLRLYSTAEDRLGKLRDNTRLLAETISNLQSDITMYVTAASEQLDMISGQIQAIGTAADASMVMLELRQSLDALTDSVNMTTRFVAETQTYFRENVDSMIEDLEIYDEETRAALTRSNVYSEVAQEFSLDDMLADALAKKIESLADTEESRVVLEHPVEVEAQR